jgi:mannose-6-phosphate isomerase-like protein (cupin superfamily)
MISKTDKPWGYEYLIEQNAMYVVKLISMNEKHSCSLQFHEKKHETIYVISGALKFIYGTDSVNLKEIELRQGDSFVIPPQLIHRMEALEDSIYIEASTNHLEDVIRLEDIYGRI